MDKLKVLQASLVVLAYKVKNYHWNFKGAGFFVWHKETDKLASKLIELADDVAEKILMHELPAIGNLKEVLELSVIEEVSTTWYRADDVSNTISADLDKIIQLTKTVESTPTVQPLLDEIFLVTDKAKWQFSRWTK
ncbi:DNA starvation/stationary phase protection protein [Mycoplasma iguanae]|uniref:DNA starvation/stationary phase protection protein n=1 Tax=Mycoplasma iguanae TaxID=292461 RepID=A0ABY5R862_9MOLU|nr:DNA starvation/stationary phase protection protein [Mycoplasma iguanae]UVD81679.1 DNA starvation/stationary phase protection protein [Mycoplasma iguanae]